MSPAPGEFPYVVIIGGGKVGFYLAKHLIERGYEVTLVEKDATRAEWIEHQLGSVSVMVGDGDEMAFLSTTGIERAGVVIACQLAKGKFGVSRTIARVNNPVNVNVFTALGVDVPVSATDLLMGLIESEISVSDAVRGIAVKASGANLIDVALPDMSSLEGRPVGTITLPPGDVIVCIVRDGQPVIPAASEVIKPRDELIVYSRRLDIAAVRDSLLR